MLPVNAVSRLGHIVSDLSQYIVQHILSISLDTLNNTTINFFYESEYFILPLNTISQLGHCGI